MVSFVAEHPQEAIPFHLQNSFSITSTGLLLFEKYGTKYSIMELVKFMEDRL